jgi:HEAT repeat protein
MAMSLEIQKSSEEFRTLFRDWASKFLEVVYKKFGFHLNYTESSLYISDYLLTLFFKERRSSDLAATIIGSYLGEVILQNLGGKWDPSGLAIVKIGRMKGTAYPFKQAKLRLEKGFGGSLIHWYADLKMRFCLNGDLSWNGNTTTNIYRSLLEQDWDLKLLNRLLNESEKPYAREEAAFILKELKSSRVAPALVEALRKKETAYYACIALQGIKAAESIPILRCLCGQTEDIPLQVQAIQALGSQGDERIVSFLLEKLNEKDEVIAHYASQSLGKIGGEKVIHSLLDIIRNGNSRKKILAISAFELMGNKDCVPDLIQCLQDPKEEVRESAARAFQYIPDPRASEALISLLSDRSSQIRILAAYALTFIGEKNALESLKTLLKDPVKNVRDHVSYLIPLLESGEKPAGYCW